MPDELLPNAVGLSLLVILLAGAVFLLRRLTRRLSPGHPTLRSAIVSLPLLLVGLAVTISYVVMVRSPVDEVPNGSGPKVTPPPPPPKPDLQPKSEPKVPEKKTPPIMTPPPHPVPDPAPKSEPKATEKKSEKSEPPPPPKPSQVVVPPTSKPPQASMPEFQWPSSPAIHQSCLSASCIRSV